MTRRVVITGLGLVTPVGNTVEDTWTALMAGRSGADATGVRLFPLPPETEDPKPVHHLPRRSGQKPEADKNSKHAGGRTTRPDIRAGGPDQARTDAGGIAETGGSCADGREPIVRSMMDALAPLEGVMDCGGKRSATPLSARTGTKRTLETPSSAQKRCRASFPTAIHDAVVL